jgi:DNA helicase-2/ATP-dependent DNA helicase PcrA
MSDPLREPGFLTAHQLRAVLPERDVFLTACPGSGKTRAGGARIARVDDDGRRIASCSYTNVGVEALRRVINVDLGYTLHTRQFVGTLHQFLLRYVLYPFGHLATGSGTTPRLYGEDFNWRAVTFNNNPRLRLNTDRFHYRPDGSLCVRGTPPTFPLSDEKAAADGQADALRLKAQAAQAGIVSFDDAMYWALRVLEDRPAIAAAVAGRFDEILVDEAQDTSELQLACLTAICNTGKLDSLVLIGDLEQSISAYNGASRAGCEALACLRGLQDIPFEENHRSSQRICDVTFHFCSRTSPDTAVGPDKGCEHALEILLYQRADPRSSVERFRQRLADIGHDHAEAAVLARGNALVDELNGQSTAVKILPRPLAVARALSTIRGGGTLGRHEIEAIDRIIAFTAAGQTDLSELTPRQRWACRVATMELLRRAPSLDTDLREWIKQIATILGEIVARIAHKPAHGGGQVLRSAADQSGHLTGDVVRPRARILRAQTVHDIKGESRGAVLVVVDRLRSAKRGAQSALWSQHLGGEAVAEEDAEELRIAFVALTRAQRYCALALPDDCEPDVIDAYESIGFVRA